METHTMCEECQKWCGDLNNLIYCIIDDANQSKITPLDVSNIESVLDILVIRT